MAFGSGSRRNGARRRRRPALLALPALLAVLAAAGCREEAAPPPADGRPQEPVPGGTALVAIDVDPGVLNPLIYFEALPGLIYAEIHDGLAEVDEELQWRPAIARSWDVAPDGLSITYHLRPWAWSDGQPLTAYDVARSFQLFVDPVVASPRRGFFREVLRAVAIDSATVRYDFERPQPDPVARTYHQILPLHVVRDLDPAQVATWPLNEAPLSCGPFLLEDHEFNRQLSLVRNPRYPGPSALLDRVIFRVMPEASARIVALEVGEVDLLDHLPPSAAKRLAAGGAVRVVPTGGRRFYYLLWNLQNPRLHDAATRRALSIAIDREGMIAALLDGYGKPAASPIPPALWNHHRDLAPPAYDPERARRELADAGWRDTDGDGVLERDGLRLAFQILVGQGDPVRENGALILRDNLKQAGAEAEIWVLERAASLARVNSGSFDAYFGLFNANLYGDPSGYVHSRAVDQYNKGSYANAEVDSLLELALGLTDRQAALPHWLRLQEVLAADPPSAYLFYPDNLVGVSLRLKGVRPHLLSPYNNLAEWWIAPEDRKFKSAP